MQFKKSKTFLAAILAAAMTASAILPTAASAAGSRTKEEKYGDSTYAERFLSFYDDVVTNGVENGYMSSQNTVADGLGVPYHSVEELCIEAPDYGHETTSEALSYLVWMAAQHDAIVNDGAVPAASAEKADQLAKAWRTLEATMVPDVQNNFMNIQQLSATYSDEWEQIELYPTGMDDGVKGVNPLHSKLCSAYGSDKGLYLMHWLADVDDWYGFGKANAGTQSEQTSLDGPFTLINTFQRGEQESCWETIPHACVDMHNKGYGIKGSGGMKGFFNTEDAPAEQFSYTNAPDAEDRAIQAVYAANRWGVPQESLSSKWGGNQTVSALAGKMGDETRNNMFDKYYITIGAQNKNAGTGSDNGQHYLMNWYTSWGGAHPTSGQNWAWQIGASHMHEFYQNPLAAYALLYDDQLNGGMKSQGATDDFQKSLTRQIEFYLWLQSADGPIAGGATNSYKGRYETYPDNDHTFYKMYYLEHPVYADPGSNHWIGNQVWAVQRLAELYSIVKAGGDNPTIGQTGMTLDAALEKILDKWVGWFLDYTILGKANGEKTITAKYEPYDTATQDFVIPDVSQGTTDDGENFSIPASLIWEGMPDYFDGKAPLNNDLHCTIVGYGDGDLGCVSSLANTLIYYAKAKGVKGEEIADGKASYEAAKGTAASVAEYPKQALYVAKELIDRQWNKYRDDIGLGVEDHNTNLVRLWETKLVLPDGQMKNGQGQVLSKDRYTGKMPNGDTVENGVAFVDIRSNYKDVDMYQKAKAEYDATGNTDGYYFTLHRFWHAGDIAMAIGAMYENYPELTPDGEIAAEDIKLTPEEATVRVGENTTIKSSVEGVTFKSSDESIATVDADGVVLGVAPGEVTITAEKDGKTATAKVTVTDNQETTTTVTTTTDKGSTTADGTTTVKAGPVTDGLLGDTNLDGKVDITDAVLLNKKLADTVTFNDQQNYNGDCYDLNGEVEAKDATSLLKFIVQSVKSLPEIQ